MRRLLLALAVCLWLGHLAYADEELIISDGSSSVTLDETIGCSSITDSSIACSTTPSGQLDLGGTIDGWSFNLDSGVGSPLLPNGTLDLSTLNVGGSGALTITFSENNLTAPIPGWDAGFGGTISGGSNSYVDYSAYEDNNNLLASGGGISDATSGGGFQIGDTGQMFAPGTGGVVGGSFEGLATTPVNTAGYSLIQQVTICGSDPTIVGGGPTCGSTTVESGDATLTPVPEPGSLMLLGSGLIGLAGIGRKKFLKG